MNIVEAVVTCNETTMTIEMAKTYTIKRNEDNLHLNSFTDSSCDLKRLSNETHVVVIMELGACGTHVEVQRNKNEPNTVADLNNE